MLDSNICIRVLRERPPHLRERFDADSHRLSISTIVLHELHYGAERSARPEYQREQVAAFAAHLSVVDFDQDAAREAARIKADLAAIGQMIGPNDLLIAGHARSLGLRLITGNLREFSRVEGLRCEDWLG